jgi:uncharacterized protein (DUF924 family)
LSGRTSVEIGEMDDTRIDEVLDFWFGGKDSAALGSKRAIWFEESPPFDEQIRARFGRLHERAAEGELDHWRNTATGCLALIIILDQFSRNLFRTGPRAYACDVRAREHAELALARGYDKSVFTVQRVFCYLPFEHTEDLSVQEKSVELFVKLGASDYLQHAVCHRDQIVRFGRFPDRNAALGRKNTPAEEAFLAKPFC